MGHGLVSRVPVSQAGTPRQSTFWRNQSKNLMFRNLSIYPHQDIPAAWCRLERNSLPVFCRGRTARGCPRTAAPVIGVTLAAMPSLRRATPSGRRSGGRPNSGPCTAYNNQIIITHNRPIDLILLILLNTSTVWRILQLID